MGRVAAAVLLAAALALAGCTGSLPGTGPTLDDVEYPLGVSDDGVNATALADAHAAALDDRSFTVEMGVEQTAPNGDESMDLVAAVGPERDRMHVDLTADERTTVLYLTEDREYEKVTEGGSTTYDVRDRTLALASLPTPSPSGARWVELFAGEANYTPTDVVVEDGIRLVVLTANRTTLDAPPNTDVTSFESRMLVAEDGTVHRLTLDVEAEEPDGEKQALSVAFAVSDVGDTDVPEPDWLDDARAAANETG